MKKYFDLLRRFTKKLCKALETGKLNSFFNFIEKNKFKLSYEYYEQEHYNDDEPDLYEEIDFLIFYINKNDRDNFIKLNLFDFGVDKIFIDLYINKDTVINVNIELKQKLSIYELLKEMEEKFEIENL